MKPIFDRELVESDALVLLVGNPVDGLNLIGPFSGYEQAIEHAESEYSTDSWWVALLAKP